MKRYGQIIGVKPEDYERYKKYHVADMAKMAADPKIQEWWAIMEPMQDPVSTRVKGEWWANMEEVFHMD
jgi:L-rhamnose mutarotase